MAVPKVPRSKQHQAESSKKLIYVGFTILWTVLGGVMVLALKNFAELWSMSQEAQAIVAINQQSAAATAANAVNLHKAAAVMPQMVPETKGVAKKASNPNDMFVVGIMFADKQKYVDSLQAEVDTWMSEIDNERIFAIGPAKALENKPGFPRVPEHRCEDRSLWCKRVQHIAEAYKMLQKGIHFDWVLSGNEDWYVNMAEMRRALSEKDPNDPVVYATMGCSLDWEHNPSSEKGTKPIPKGYRVDPEKQCEKLSKRGGVCGGYGIVFSRAAIEIMMKDGGEEALFATTMAEPFPWKVHPQGDPVLSCLIYAFEDKGVRMEERPWVAQDSRKIIKNQQMEFGGRQVGTSHGVPWDGMDGATILRKIYDVQTSSAASAKQ